MHILNFLAAAAAGRSPALRRVLRGAIGAGAILALLSVGRLSGQAGEVIPPAPQKYFNDYAHVVSADTAAQLNRTLEDFERQASSQILVAVYPKMESDSSVEDYTVRVAQSWKVGQKEKNNGAVLFVFVQDRKMFLQVGYGLEGALPDALAKRIIENELKPRFRNGDFDGGLKAGVAAILAATRGEYRGSGRTVAQGRNRAPFAGLGFFALVTMVIVVMLVGRVLRAATGTVYTRRRYSSWGGWGGWGGGGGISSGGWGGGGGGGGGGFSGGGGSFGGGGAGGSW
jgi:uncharacterized protein